MLAPDAEADQAHRQLAHKRQVANERKAE